MRPLWFEIVIATAQGISILFWFLIFRHFLFERKWLEKINKWLVDSKDGKP